jgi:hypothetical protein
MIFSFAYRACVRGGMVMLLPVCFYFYLSGNWRAVNKVNPVLEGKE